MDGHVTVADLLLASRAAHLRYRQHAGRVDKAGKVTQPPDYLLAEDACAEALRYRLDAHAADPDHADAEWQNDRVPHAELVAYYAKYPSIP